jgi:uncharacterized protein
MSNMDTVRQILDAVGRGDADAFREHMAEHVRWEFHPTGNTAQNGDVPYLRLREGPEAAAGFLRDIEADFEIHSFDVQSLPEGDGRVAVLLGFELTVRATGKRVRDEEIHLYEFGPDGRVSAFRHFLDTAKAIEAHS